MQNAPVKNADAVSRAEKIFKKEKMLAEGTAAWAEYQQKQAAMLANMERLRALRLSLSDSGSVKGDANVDVKADGSSAPKSTSMRGRRSISGSARRSTSR